MAGIANTLLPILTVLRDVVVGRSFLVRLVSDGAKRCRKS